MGVFENVEVLGRSGADLETELLHHETSPGAAGASYASTDLPASATDRETTPNEPGGETTFDVPEGSGAETSQQTGGTNDLEHSLGAGSISPADTSPPAEPEAPTPDPDASSAAGAADGDA